LFFLSRIACVILLVVSAFVNAVKVNGLIRASVKGVPIV